MRVPRKSDYSGRSPDAAYYRDKAGAMRETAARTKFPDTREQLLWIASQYELLAERAAEQQEAASEQPRPAEVVSTD